MNITREKIVMELLREHSISQGKAAELLGIARDDLFEVMTRYKVPVVDLTPEELKEELSKDLSFERARFIDLEEHPTGPKKP